MSNDIPELIAPYMDEARAIHRELPVFIGYLDFSLEQFRESGGIQCDIEKLDAAGVRYAVVSIGYGCYFQIGPGEYVLAGPDEWLFERMLERVDWVADTIHQTPRARLITESSQLQRKPDDDSIGFIIHLTGNNHTFALDCVDSFFEHGVRATHPAMQYHNRWCTGIGGMPGPAITDFGKKVVRRMNDIGIQIDVAHASDESAQAIIRASNKPVIDGHTTSRDLVPSSRGLSDQTLRMIAESGGVVGVHFADHLLSEEVWRRKQRKAKKTNAPPRIWAYNRHLLETVSDPDKRVKLRKDKEAQERFYRQNGLPPEPTPSTERIATLVHMADVFDYLIKLLGDDHVAVGGDVNGIGNDQWPLGMDHIGELPNLTAMLLKRGYSRERLGKILCANWLRMYDETLPK